MGGGRVKMGVGQDGRGGLLTVAAAVAVIVTDVSLPLASVSFAVCNQLLVCKSMPHLLKCGVDF